MCRNKKLIDKVLRLTSRCSDLNSRTDVIDERQLAYSTLSIKNPDLSSLQCGTNSSENEECGVGAYSMSGRRFQAAYHSGCMIRAELTVSSHDK